MDVFETLKRLSGLCRIEMIAMEAGLTLNSRLRGPCPTGHESKSGTCFVIIRSKNYAYCHHCHKSFDPVGLFALCNNMTIAKAVQVLAQRHGIAKRFERKNGDYPNYIPHNLEKSIQIQGIHDQIKEHQAYLDAFENVCSEVYFDDPEKDHSVEIFKISEREKIKNDINMLYDRIEKLQGGVIVT